MTSDASADVTDILLHTRRRWGNEQRDRYAAVLDRAIASLADHPESGQRRDHLFPGCRVRIVGRHVLYYHVGAEVIEVVRILHSSADPARHLQR